MTRAEAHHERAAAGRERTAPSWNAAASGRSSQAVNAAFVVAAVVSAAAILVAAPALALWLLLPAIPAGLLFWANRRAEGSSRCDRAVMRIFSVATFVAVVSQMFATATSLLPLVIVGAAVVLFVHSLERIAIRQRHLSEERHRSRGSI